MGVAVSAGISIIYGEGKKPAWGRRERRREMPAVRWLLNRRNFSS